MSADTQPEHYKGVFVTRLLWVYGLLAVWVLAIAVRLVQLQVFRVEQYRVKAHEQQTGFLERSSRRGEILDRRLLALAISVPVDSVCGHRADPKLRDSLAASYLLAPVLGVSESDIFETLSLDRDFVYLARKLNPRQIERVRQLKIHGISIQPESRRVYPARTLAGQVLGFVDIDNVGLGGLEYRFNELIKGKKYRVDLRVDAEREQLGHDPRAVARDGNTLVLNLDREIQYFAEEALQDTVLRTGAKSGCAIVMDPHQGDVLASASYPFLNANRPQDHDDEAKRDRAILHVYEPGSTFKIVTLSAVLNEGLADLSETVDCRVGTLRLGGKVYREAKHSYGDLTVGEILARSSNVGTIKLALRLGDDRLFEYAKRFGFGAKTGIELPGEEVGLLRPPSDWSRLSIGAISIGHEIGVTPIQMLRAAAVLANGGYLVQPRLVDRVQTAEGDPVYRSPVVRTRILKPQTVRKMKLGLAMAVDDGTGQSARLDGYSSGGKTGTAQKYVDGRLAQEKYVASFVGFAPLEEARLAAIVVIDEPEGSYYGGQVAAPAFAQIMERSLVYLNVPHDRLSSVPPASLAEAARPRDSKPAAAERRDEDDLPPDRFEAAMAALIETSQTETNARRVTVRTDWFELQDFSRMSLRQAARECVRLGLQLRVSGSGVVVAQRPPAGSRVAKGAVCELFLSMEEQKDQRSKASSDTSVGTGTAYGHEKAAR
jgi:cell division protein FtsI (penicillin-binding protein 3)